MSQLEFLHQLRNARLIHLLFLIKEDEREDRELEITICWAREQLAIAEKNLAKSTLEWDQERIDDPDFEEELQEDQDDIQDEYHFYKSWL